MRTDLKSRLGRVSAAIAVGLASMVGVASTAGAQTWNGWVPYNGYNNSTYPYYNRSQDPGWTWGERYGAPPVSTYYSAPGYYRAPYGNGYSGNGQTGPGQVDWLFGR